MESIISVHANMNEIYGDALDGVVVVTVIVDGVMVTVIVDGVTVTVIDDDCHFDLSHNKNGLNGLYKCLVSVHVDVTLSNSQRVCGGCQSPFQYSDLWRWMHLQCDQNRRSKSHENVQSKISLKRTLKFYDEE